MKVKQLISEETYPEYIARLTKTVGKRLGKGVAGFVYPHPKDKNVVVKVFGFDEGYERYLRWASKNQNNKYVPKIIGVNTAQVADGYITIAFLEKLKEIKDPEYYRWGEQLFAIAYPDAEIPAYVQIKDFKSSMWQRIARNTTDMDLKALARYMSRPEVHNDIHRMNIMKRGSQLVVIDPSSS